MSARESSHGLKATIPKPQITSALSQERNPGPSSTPIPIPTNSSGISRKSRSPPSSSPTENYHQRNIQKMPSATLTSNSANSPNLFLGTSQMAFDLSKTLIPDKSIKSTDGQLHTSIESRSKPQLASSLQFASSALQSARGRGISESFVSSPVRKENETIRKSADFLKNTSGSAQSSRRDTETDTDELDIANESEQSEVGSPPENKPFESLVERKEVSVQVGKSHTFDSMSHSSSDNSSAQSQLTYQTTKNPVDQDSAPHRPQHEENEGSSSDLIQIPGHSIQQASTAGNEINARQHMFPQQYWLHETHRLEARNLRLKLKDWYLPRDKKIKLPDIVAISIESNSSNILLVDKENNFVVKCNFEDYSGSLLFVQNPGFQKIECGELLKKSFGPNSNFPKFYALIVSEAETWNFRIRNIYLHVLRSQTSTFNIFSLVFYKKIIITKNFVFDKNSSLTKAHLSELPSGNLLCSLTGSQELYKIFRTSDEHFYVDRPIILKNKFQCMTICNVATYCEYLVVALSDGIIEVYRIEDEDELIPVVSIPPLPNLISIRISNLIWDPINKILMSKCIGKSSFDVYSITNSGGLIRRIDEIKTREFEDAILEAKVFAIRLNQLFVYNSKKNHEAFYIFRLESNLDRT